MNCKLETSVINAARSMQVKLWQVITCLVSVVCFLVQKERHQKHLGHRKIIDRHNLSSHNQCQSHGAAMCGGCWISCTRVKSSRSDFKHWKDWKLQFLRSIRLKFTGGGGRWWCCWFRSLRNSVKNSVSSFFYLLGGIDAGML